MNFLKIDYFYVLKHVTLFHTNKMKKLLQKINRNDGMTPTEVKSMIYPEYLQKMIKMN